MTEHGGRDVPYQLTVPPDGFVVIEKGLGVLKGKHNKSPLEPLLFLSREGLAADEVAILVEGYSKSKAGHERRILVGDVVAPVMVTLISRSRRVISAARALK